MSRCWPTKARHGEVNGRHKLTADQALAIYRTHGRYLREVASDYGISLQQVWDIQMGRAWGWLTRPQKAAQP